MMCEPGDARVGKLVREMSAVELLEQMNLLPSKYSVSVSNLERDRALQLGESCGAVWVTPGHAHWPQQLAVLGDTQPLGLWVRGNPEILMQSAVSIVGARASTSYGDRLASDIAAGVAAERWVIVSGGAYGIDAAAHRGAMIVHGATIAILAGGVDDPYPHTNAAIFERMLERGALVSEFAPGNPPQRHRFLIRNRLIAAWSAGTVVVEAKLRSGAIATAGHAAALGKDVMAVPGPVISPSSQGCHQLIRDGAVLVATAADVFELVAGDLPRHSLLPV